MDAVEVLRLGDQQQLGVAARADEREALQQVPVGEVLAGGHELALVLRALLVLEPPPRGVELQERVLDEVARAHRRRLSQPGRARQIAAARGRPRRRIQWLPCGSRCSRRIRGRIRVASPATSRRSPRELAARGHEAAHPRAVRPRRRALAPPAPRRAPAARARPPEGFVSLGRTVGLPANGAVSNLALTPHAVLAMRRELRDGGYDVLHIHEPVVPLLGWDALARAGELPLVGTFHTYSENAAHQRHRRGPARRAPADEPPARAHRRLRGRRLDRAALLRRALPDHPQRRAPRGPTRRSARRARPRASRRAAAHPVHRPGRRTQGPAGAAARVRGAARADPGDAHARRRRARRRSRT